MKRFVAAFAMTATLALSGTGSALADNVHLLTGMSGQPDKGGSIVNCGGSIGSIQIGSTPGNANPTNQGSPFTSNPNGSVAGSHYAGSQPQNSTNPNSISQYDVACLQATLHQNP